MLPLISNALPTTPTVATQSAPANAALLLGGSADAGASSRQFLSNAVVATGAPAAYFPGTAPQRPSPMQGADRAQRVAVPPPTGDYIELQPAPQPAPSAAARFSAPVTLGIPLTTQLTAQFMGQQAVRPAGSEPASQPTPLRGKEQSFGSARGVAAYGIAAARTASIPAAPEVEAAE